MNEDRQGSADRERRRIDFAAAKWAVLHDRGLTAREQDEFLQWLACDRRHSEAFRRQQATWCELDALAQWRPEHSVQPNPGLLEERAGRGPGRWIALALAASVACGLTAWHFRASPPPGVPVAEATALNYERRVLNDGSVVELNRGATIEAHYTPGEREISLVRGEAFFKVAKNPLRPFIVRANGIAVQAVGTAFNVRLVDGAVDVLVTEGRVKIANGDASDQNPPLLVAAGEHTLVPVRGHGPVAVAKASATEISQALAWQPQMLDFSSTPLGDMVAEFNRHNRVQIVIADPTLAHLAIVGAVRSDNVDGFVRLLETAAGVRAERSTTTIVLTRSR
ncbi:FecR domain-containing protein [Horticoccus luteus]|uniref:FecR domain-containing protein n=1 Tax=Horticoccus luteus TaxID=2862869 RepID=A0A8F9TZN0_9BACT|nr:FecR domain-containing protein [Horticoccus luteus]QYM80447.1 FecR domain-containing protein [Horticoccus luteus]